MKLYRLRRRRPGAGSKFPGEIAGASLKRGRRSRRGPPGREFPGEIAGASLKLAICFGPQFTAA